LSDRAVAVGEGSPDLGEALDKRYNPLIRAMRSLPKPIVCAVNGAAAGAGANFALACDIVLAAKSAKFLQAFARIGLVPDVGGTWILPRLVGDARARALMMLADPIGAEEAAAWGMIYRAVDDDQLMGQAREIAERLAAGPTRAYGLMKRAFAASFVNSLDAQLDLERDLQREAGRSDDFVEGVRAFLEKRQANFRTARGGS
jgi:2-(1,2-epoxy-1,2-dihydrophenyl)acetyl-CoA isomerase